MNDKIKCDSVIRHLTHYYHSYFYRSSIIVCMIDVPDQSLTPLTPAHHPYQSFWTRLSGKYGNKFYWRENGEAKAILDAVSAVDTCLREEPGRFKCSQVRERN